MKTAAKTKYRWCLHCERTYKKGEFRPEYDGYSNFTFKMCPYEGCDGDTVVDGMNWNTVREGREEVYPEEPVSGIVYPLYPKDDDLRRLAGDES